jgi:hypothetical protein
MIFIPTIIFASITENQRYCTMCISVKETSMDNSNIIGGTIYSNNTIFYL